MKDVSFDGLAEPGSDLRAAWRERLEREGKLEHRRAAPIRDLVLAARRSPTRVLTDGAS